MSDPTPSVYFILGTPDSGRRAVVRDLIENGLSAEEKAVVLLAESEEASPADERIGKLPQAEIRRWSWKDSAFPAMKLPAGATIFLLADPRSDMIDQLEALKPWLQQQGLGLARIFFFVDCQLAEKNPVLGQWYSAGIRFADVVFLAKREGVANKWLSDFIQHYKGEFVPCHFIQVKKGDLANPALILDPSPRRLSQYFEEAEDFSDLVIETDDEEEEAGGEDETGLPEPEPYFVRQRSGRRDKELPDVREFLPKK